MLPLCFLGNFQQRMCYVLDLEAALCVERLTDTMKRTLWVKAFRLASTRWTEGGEMVFPSEQANSFKLVAQSIMAGHLLECTVFESTVCAPNSSFLGSRNFPC